GQYFREWVSERIELTPEHEGRLNARSCFGPESYALLQSADEVEALDRYLALWRAALAHVRAEECGGAMERVAPRHAADRADPVHQPAARDVVRLQARRVLLGVCQWLRLG